MRRIVLALAALLWAVWATSPANAGSLTLLGAGGPGAAASLTYAYQSVASVTTGGLSTPQTFSNMSAGTAAASRVLVVAIGWKGTNAAGMDLTSVTIGGVTATQAVYSRPSGIGHAIYYAAVPTGTTATVVVSFTTSGFVDEIFVHLASLTGSATASVATTYTTPAYANGLTTSPSITVPANGVAIISNMVSANGGTTVGSAWTGATVDHEIWDGNNFGTGAAIAHVSTSGTVSETSVPGGGPTGWVAAAFQP